ncbi:hypothetical protein Q4E40_12715 [Pontibacter sp. BT731]|uniref:hypothetical protein n=1 Tax=Pontibacter coccineus TaxID=3063328 RepID=UPI0026E27F77|nr:hypothetical protein [Pontibacter sp. BT731]MDO6390996.1 hypothetical protein [Pontibacter sp. BT731]
MNEISISLSYKVQGGDIFDDLEKDLKEEYIINVQSKPGTAAMGIWDSMVEIIVNVELKDYVMIVLGGAAWDLVKAGSRSFFLRPLVQAFEKLEKQHEYFDYTSLRLKFQDTEIVVYGLKKLLSSRLGTTMPLITIIIL